MNLDLLTRILSPLHHSGPTALELKGVTANSRQVQKGYVFVAIRGARGNGLEHLPDALARGAAAVVSEEEVALPRGVAHLRVADARLALARVAAAFFRNPSHYLKTVGASPAPTARPPSASWCGTSCAPTA
jgi:UDP-N-acetylmuramoyl-L-alanyl-D-glutamate--2,6-diaminopimelate ligase